MVLGWVENMIGAGLVVAGLTTWGAASSFTVTLSLDHLLCGFSGLLLAQGLVRDLWVIRSRREGGKSGRRPAVMQAPPSDGPAFNLCLESTVGAMLLGLALLYAFVPQGFELTLPVGMILAGSGLILIGGWQLRDWVLTLHHVPDHYDLPVWRPSQRVKVVEPAAAEPPAEN